VGDATLGLYLVPIDLGTTTGAVKVTFDPNTVPDGIRAVYNGIVFNAFSAVLDGYHATSVSNGLTYMGNSGSEAGLVATHALDEYELYEGTFTANGDTTSVVVSAGSVSTSAGDPGDCVLYIPKTLSTTTSLLIEIAEALTENPSWSLDVGCPAPLDSWTCTANIPLDACTDALDEAIYVGKVSGSPSAPVVNDWAFADANASATKAMGSYGVLGPDASRWTISVNSNGIITSSVVCP
tara:strand:+ start:509 stop:1222 length:714 start_codon:yes stop_codon:yes gene_type:complete